MAKEPHDEFDFEEDDEFDEQSDDGLGEASDDESDASEDDFGDEFGDEEDEDEFLNEDNIEFGYFGERRRGRPSEKEIRREDEAMQRRQDHFRVAADYVTRHLAKVPSVQKVAIIGSVASPLKREVPRFREFRRYNIEVLHECGGLDLAVWVTDLSNLTVLRKCRSQAVNEVMREKNVGVAHHQVSIFLLEPGTNRYLGFLCMYGQCPKGKPACAVPGCGAEKFLQVFEDFHFFPWALDPEKSIVLFEREPSAPATPKRYFVQIDVEEAGKSFKQLLKHIENGGKVVVTRKGEPIIRMTPAGQDDQPKP